MNGHLLRLLHLASPALPIGGFHFSQGLEYAVESAWVKDEATALEWIAGVAEHSLGRLDLPVLARLHNAWRDRAGLLIQRWNDYLLACRETQELRAEDRHMGAALAKVLIELDVSTPAPKDPSYATVFALACAHWEIPTGDTLEAYAWAWTENQVLAAVKLVPLGQSAGQRILHCMIPKLAAAASCALELTDDDIGIAAIMPAIASIRHETQYTRLFRS